MRSARFRWIVCFQVFLFGVSPKLQTIWCINLDNEIGVSRRSDESVWAEGLPLWLERKRLYSTYPSLTDDSQLVQSIRKIHHINAEDQSSMEDREQRQLERLRRVMDGEAVPYENYRGEESYTDKQIRLVRRAPVFDQGLSPKAAWLPIVVGAACILLVTVTLIGTATYYYRIHLPRKSKRDKSDSLIGRVTEQTTVGRMDGDRKLAYSAQMYHYQHQKQQMFAVERANSHLRGSDDGSESEAEETDFTVYECPTLTETGELEVQNPLFDNGQMVHEPSANGSSGEIIHTSDLDDLSERTPAPRSNNSSNLSHPAVASLPPVEDE